MNAKAKNVLICYVVLMSAMLLFPPTLVVTTISNLDDERGIIADSTSISGGFRFIGMIGGSRGQFPVTRSTSMDVRQLSIQIVIVSLMACAAYVAFKKSQGCEVGVRATDQDG